MYKNELKIIDTKEKAYLLGLIYSDGHIGKYNGNYITTICLHENDEYLLDLLIKYFPFFTKRKHTTNKAFILSCTKKQLVLDLETHGVLERKSTLNKDFLKIPNLHYTLIPHFIRGYFDGDGCVYKQKQGNIKIEIGGTCFSLISEIQKQLYNNKITVNMTCKYAGIASRKHDFYVIYTSSDKVSKQFANYIYQDKGELFLQRKYDKLYFVPEYNNKKERLQCQLCNSFNTVFNGVRNDKIRIKCKDCGKMCSITAPQSSNILSGEDELLEG